MALISFLDTESFVKEIISIHFVARCELLTLCTVWKGSLKYFDLCLCVCVYVCLVLMRTGGSISHCMCGRNLKIALLD